MNDVGPSPAIRALVEAGALPADPLPWILDSTEPWARWVALTQVLLLPDDHPRAAQARRAVVADPTVSTLVASLPAWEADTHGHHSPLFVPNRLGLLATMGLRAGDDAKIDGLAETMLESRDRQGRFVMPKQLTARPKPEKGSVDCDSNAVADVLIRLGFGDDPRLQGAVRRLIGDAGPSMQGQGWRCMPEKRPIVDFGARRADACPQVTIEGARVLASLPPSRRPAWADHVARTLLTCWTRRATDRPYEFGHGYQFKTVKWPSFWYDVLGLLDAVTRFPALWQGREASAADRRAIVELAAVLIAHNVGADGRVTPTRAHRGLEQFSFGRRGEPSPFATARVLGVLARVADLGALIAEVDVDALPASRPLTHPRSETAAAPAAPTCPVPQRRTYDFERVLPRVLARHHLGTPWEPASIESLASDIVGFTAGHPVTPYASLAARLPDLSSASVDRALDERRSLVRIRCMRGILYAVRRDFVPVVHAASTRQVVRWARDFVRGRGIDASEYESAADQVLALTSEAPLTTGELRERLRPGLDLAAVVTLMLAEARLLRCAPRDGRFGRRPTFAPFELALPDVQLGRVSEDDARATLLRAYVRGFGPVSARDAAWWTGMDLKRVRRAFDALEDELIEISLAGHEGTWLMHAADAEELERASLMTGPNVALLPPYDPLLLSYTDRSRFMDDTVRPYVFDTARNVTAVVLLNGRVIGVWDVQREPQPRALVHLLEPVDGSARESIEAEARRMAAVRLETSDPPVSFVDSMVPLSERQVGAYRHPLR